MTATDLVQASPKALLTELGDGTGVLLDLETKFYFTLNRTGVVVWKALVASASGASAEVLARALVKEFDVALDVALTDVLGILSAIEQEGLLRVR